MKLLIITQVIDTEHPILGFFTRWSLEFAKHCEHVHIIALQVGKHDLPANVTVHSLGKENYQTGGPSLRRSETTGKVGPRVFSILATKLRYTIRFYKLIWQLRHEYDNVFVHMNQVYVILGAPLWRTLGKRVGLWYAHGAVTRSLQLSVRLAHLVFTSTVQGMRVITPKRIIVGQGIDTALFTTNYRPANDTLTLITVGRVSQSKNISTLLHACALLKNQGINFNFRIVGPSTTPTEEQYATDMHTLASELGVASHVTWVGSVPQADLPAELQAADFFIHDGSTNSLDKALLEAALCGCVVISSNPSYRGLTANIAPNFLYPPHDSTALAAAVEAALSDQATTTITKNTVTTFVQNNHSVSNLISVIVGKY